MRRFSTLTAVAGGLVLTTLLLTGCGSDKAKDTTADTTVAAAETTVAAAAETTVAAADTTVAAATETTVAVAAETTAAASTDTVAADTAAAGATDTVAAAGDLTSTLVTQMIMGMTGGTSADPADVKCISEKVSEADLSKLVTATGSAPDPTAMKAIIKAAFQCKPKGLADNMVKSTFTDVSADVTEDQKACIAGKILDVIASDDAVIEAMLQSDSKMPESLKPKFTKVVEDCVPAGAARDALLKDLLKA
jgi:hypothetical protein